MNTFANTFRLRCNAALALAAFVYIGAAVAEPPSPDAKLPAGTVIEKRTVRYSDLDLTVQSDVIRLYRRIDRAAAAVCGGRTSALALRSPRFGSCRGKALADAIHQVNAAELTAYHESKRRGASPGIKTYAQTNKP